MKTLNPKLILYHINDGEKTWEQLRELLGNPNPNWMSFHIKMWKNKGMLDIITSGKTTIIKKRI